MLMDLTQLKQECINTEQTQFQDLFSTELWESTYKDHTDINIDDTMFRVAYSIASIEKTPELRYFWTKNFYIMLTNFKTTAGGRIYANAGTEWGGTTLMNCISSDTKVLTSTGIYYAKDIPLGKIEVLTKNGYFQEAEWSCHGIQQLYKITFSNNEIIFATKDHEWEVTKPSGGIRRVTTENLIGCNVPLNGINQYEYQSLEEYRKGIQNGLVFGDGYVYSCFSQGGEKYAALQQFGDSRHLILDFFDWLKITNYKGDPEGIHYVNGLDPLLKLIPPLTTSNDYLRGFIAGVIASDGHVCKRGCVVLHTADYQYAVAIRDIALKVGLPIISLKLEREGEKYSKFATKDSKLWKLTFVKKFFQKDPKLIIKNTHIENMKNSPFRDCAITIKCVSVELTSRIENVYCCNEPSTHSFTIGECGMLTGNCYVGPRVNEDLDSLQGILTHLAFQANTLKSEGGWGENFSYIRPRGAFIYGIGVETPGAVKYMELFDKSSEIITSGSGKKSTNGKAKGKIRKGAMMGCLDIWHPDIIEFITAKQQPGRLSKFNISVNCTDEFMQKVVKIHEIDDMINNQIEHMSEESSMVDLWKKERAELDNWELFFPDTTYSAYKKEWTGDIKIWLDKDYPVIVYHTTSVMLLWNMIMDSTYNRAEPGVLFLDRANYFLPLNYAETIFATNPCGEQTLAPGGVCNLGSINATQFINEDFTDFDYEKVEKFVGYLVRFLDNVNEVTKAPLPEYEYSIKHKRRIGVGIMGWASALYMLKIRFASNKASALRDKLMKVISQTAYKTSIDLAIEKGMFSLCQPEKHAEGVFIKSLDLPKEYMEKVRTTGIRNSSLLSIQPTGNTSIFANVSSGGLEPVFSHEYIRTVIVNHLSDEMKPFTPKWFEGEWYETAVFKISKEGDEEILRGEYKGIIYKIDKNRGLTKEVLCEDYGVRHMKQRNEWNPKAKWASTALALSVEDHVSDLVGFARWIDSAISKTVNCPNDYPLESFKNIYLDAYNSGVVKGVTTYRSGTMTTVLAAKDEKMADEYDEEIILADVKLPSSSPASMKILKTDGRKWYLTIVWNEQQTRPFAFFVHTNSHEKSITTNDAVDHLLQLARRKGIPEQHIETTLEKCENDNNTTKIARVISLNLRHGVLIKNIVSSLDKVDNISVGSFLFQMKKLLSSFIKDGEVIEGEICSECGSQNMIYREGCVVCGNCGHSKCG